MGNSTPPSSITDLVELLRWRADVAPAQDGFWFLDDTTKEEERLSFSMLERRARAVAAGIEDRVEPASRVLLLYPPSLQYVEAFFGCLFAGAIAVPAYPPNPKRLDRTLPRLLNIIDSSGATLVATTEQIVQMAPVLATQAPKLSEVDWLATDVIDDGAGDDWTPPSVDEQTVAFLQYTSGSTGRPKGVILEHGTLIRNQELIQQAFATGANEVGLCWVPLYHDMGLLSGVINPVYCGMDMVMMSPLDFLKRPASWPEAISKFGGTMSTGPNFAYELVTRKTPEKTLDKLDLSSWKVACNGAEPVRGETMERFATRFEPCGFDRRAFIPAYGLAEVGLIVSATPGQEIPRSVEYEGRQLVTCGPPLGDFDIRIVDPDSRQVLAEGREGEIWLRRGSVATGYWENEEATQRAFRGYTKDGEGPFLRTGDLGLVVDEELVVTGRLDDLIIIRGINHHPHDIEATVQEVDRALRPGCGAAFAVEDGGRRQLVIVQEVSAAKMDDAAALIRRIRDEVSAVHGISPRDVVLIEARTIAKTSSGKIRRFAVQNAYEKDELSVVARQKGQASPKRSPQEDPGREQDVEVPSLEPTADRRAIESWLAATVARQTGLSMGEISLDEPFSAYGVDSAQAVGIVGDLEEALGRSIAATSLYDYPTISALSAHLSKEPADDQRRPQHSPTSVHPGSGERGEGRIAIVGMACRFPGARGLEEYWRLIESGEEAIANVAEKRWEVGRQDMEVARGGIIEDIEAFDARFFGISPAEARAMDPQQRMVLETAWHAIEDARWRRADVEGSATAVFIGQSGSDFARMYQGPPVRAGSGMASSITANRLSYWLDLRGPSMIVDTACSSSLAALERAAMELRSGRCDRAIVGGVNALLDPEVSEAFAQARMLSATGRCRSFDADADGYVRGEGCGVVVLRRLDDAIRAGDRIRAVIAGCAVNQSGRTNGLMAPDGGAQEEVIRAALADADVEPGDIGVVEAQGTATEMGDAIEARALRAVFDGGTNSAVWLGSVKAQIGHLEAASGVAGLIKAALMVDRGRVGPQANFETPNPACEIEESSFRVARQVESWPTDGQEEASPRRAGVSAFGFGGTNAHVVVEQAPAVNSPRSQKHSDPGGLVCLSADSEDRLRAWARALGKDEMMWARLQSVRDLGFSLAAQRDGRRFRWSVAVDEPGGARRALAALAAGRATREEVEEMAMLQRPKLGFLFGGAAGWDKEIARRLVDGSPSLKRKLHQVCSDVEGAVDAAVWDIFFGEGDADEDLASFCLEVALCRLWMDWGIHYEKALGCGSGHWSAAVVDEGMELVEAARHLTKREANEGGGPSDVVGAMVEQDIDVVVEVAPVATLSTKARTQAGPSSMQWLALQDVSHSLARAPMEIAGRLWKRFGVVDPRLVNKGGRSVELAKSPYLREHFWPDPEVLRRPGAGRAQR